MRLIFLKIFCTIVLSILLQAGCVNQQQNNSAVNVERPQWPAAPAKARVSFINSFSTPEDFGIRKSFWQRLGELFTGSEEFQMVRPMGVTTVKDVVYVTDPGAKGLHRFDKKNNEYLFINRVKELGLVSPVAVIPDGNGGVYFSDSGLAKIFQLSQSGDEAVLLELDQELEQPTGLAMDGNSGELYVVDTKRHQVLKFDQSGEYLESIGRRGVEDGEFNFPTMISANSKGDILVTDSLNFRVQVFNKHGRYIKKIGKQGNASGHQARPKGVATDQVGNVYVVDSLFHNLQIYNESGDFLLSVGEQGQSMGQFWLPTGIHIDRQQKIYIADSHNHRVQIMQSHTGVK